MSPLRRHALALAHDELERGRGLRGLSAADRHEVEALAAAVALGVAEALEALEARTSVRPRAAAVRFRRDAAAAQPRGR
jgi:hypothetical protein